METLELPLYPTQTATLKSIPQYSSNPQTALAQAIDAILPDQAAENKTSRTRRILGETAKTLSDEQIECIATGFQFLIDTWLDEYEKEVFNDMTLQQVLNEK